jgi:sensor histidine kinase YesM
LGRGGTIAISASLDSTDHGRGPPAMLRITVTDTGAGVDRLTTGDAPAGSGVGLRSIEQRLALHYGSDARLEVTGAPGRGTRAELRLPAVIGASDEVTGAAARPRPPGLDRPTAARSAR